MTDGRHPPTLRIVRCGLVSMGVDCRITASSGAYATKLRVYYLLKDVLKFLSATAILHLSSVIVFLLMADAIFVGTVNDVRCVCLYVTYKIHVSLS